MGKQKKSKHEGVREVCKKEKNQKQYRLLKQTSEINQER